MTRRDNNLTEQSLPDAFCWTKFGAEAGEQTFSIMKRKELERQRNSGVFLWGIGNSIRPSLSTLLSVTSRPEVLFTPMKSQAARKDAAPERLVVWTDAVGWDGRHYQLPAFSLVTSRLDVSRPRNSHFALVCSSDQPLRRDAKGATSVDPDEVRNINTGATVGSSQVTSVVRRTGKPLGRSAYPVAVRACLVYPYFIRLTAPITVPDQLRFSAAPHSEIDDTFTQLLELRAEVAETARPSAEQLTLI
jgi:hypothetical protein